MNTFIAINKHLLLRKSVSINSQLSINLALTEHSIVTPAKLRQNYGLIKHYFIKVRIKVLTYATTLGKPFPFYKLHQVPSPQPLSTPS